MTRRDFSAALAAAVASPNLESGGRSPAVLLRAIAGASLPATLEIEIALPEKMRDGLWELRTYTGALPMLGSRLAEVFPRAGIRPLSGRTRGPDLTYLIPFEDLTARDRAWTVLNADPEWIRARTEFQRYHFGLYKVA